MTADEMRARAGTLEADEVEAADKYLARRRNELTQNAQSVYVGDLYWARIEREGEIQNRFFQVVALSGRHRILLRENKIKRITQDNITGFERPIRNAFCDSERVAAQSSFDKKAFRTHVIMAGNEIRQIIDGMVFEFANSGEATV